MNTGYSNELEELRAWGLQQGLKGSLNMEPTHIRLMMDGFFRRFRLIPSASYLELHHDNQTGDDVWFFVGFLPWWDEPGIPAVPSAELGIGDTQRLRRIIQTVFRNAVKRDELERVTFLRGKELTDVVRAVTGSS